MSAITVVFRDGSVKEFPDTGSPGGSYTNSVKYEGEWVIVKDAYDKTTAYPMDLVKEVTTEQRRGW